MNIEEARREIVRTLRAYHRKDAGGSPRIPRDKQRPILMIGPPGIGKTAIIAQIAAREGVGLVAYTMTHHTRQSAIGLPILAEHEYAGARYTATHYTMSEMIAAIHETGQSEGILFLDEINCVSETLAPVMLQLLQNKTFGTHAVPQGWMIVAAGNPPEYNRSVRELDMATLDRVKHMQIEADGNCWMRYARQAGVHPAIRSFLSAYPENFYVIEDRPEGQLFVTARGWEDLSCMLRAYEEDGGGVSEELILQYLQHDRVAREFALYYDLFVHAPAVSTLEGLSLSRCLVAAAAEAAAVMHMARSWKEARLCLERARELAPATEARIAAARRALELKRENQLLSPDQARMEERVLRALETGKSLPEGDGPALERRILDAYRLLESAGGDVPALYFTQEIYAHPDCAEFLSLHELPPCRKYAPELLLAEREHALLARLD